MTREPQSRTRPPVRRSALVAAGLVAGLLSVLGSAGAAQARGPVAEAYDLPTDGIRLEGIGVDHRSGAIYVSATNRDGTIYRAMPGSDALKVWVGPQPGANGRGIDVDGQGRVFVAGGPTGAVRVLASSGEVLAVLPTLAPGSFLNDVRVARDGSAYVTDSSLPIIWRVRQDGSGWLIEPWLDVARSIPYTPALTDFDLGGITTTPGGEYLLVTQGTTGRLWRIGLADRSVTQIPVDGPALVNADGIALRGHTLLVVQNFTRQISTLVLDEPWSAATTTRVTPTPSTRTFTTAKLVGGMLLAVDSTFGFASAPAADRVIAIPVATLR